MIAPSDIHFADVPLHPTTDRDLVGSSTLRSLQLGMAWFPEQPGGLDRYFYDLLNHLPAVHVNPRGIVCGSPAVEEQSLGTVRAAADSTTRMPMRLLALRRSVKQNLLDFKPDVIGAHFAFYAFPALDTFKNKPFITHFHGPWHKESRVEGIGPLGCWARYRIERAVYRRADRLITLSDFFAKELVHAFRIDESKIQVIPGGVNVARFDIPESRVQARSRLGWPVDRPIILTVRRLTRRMGLENVIDAVALIRIKRPDVLVLIAGSGKGGAQLQEQIKSIGLQDHVRLLGFLPDANLPLAYRAADLTIVPSISLEGFGLVAVESLAAGTPVITTPVGGLPEIIRPFREELLACGIAAKHLADAVIPALTNMQTLPTQAECTLYAQRYDWSVVSQSIRKVFASVL